jgi:hypothetical protein
MSNAKQLVMSCALARMDQIRGLQQIYPGLRGQGEWNSGPAGGDSLPIARAAQIQHSIGGTKEADA